MEVWLVVPEILVLPESNDTLRLLRLARNFSATQFEFCVSGNSGHRQFTCHCIGFGFDKSVWEHDAPVGNNFSAAFDVANCDWHRNRLLSAIPHLR